MQIKEVDAKAVKDSRGDKTVLVSIKTNAGNFSASAPNGKSKGKFEAKPYKKSLEEDIKTVKEFKEYFTEEYLEKFEDLRRIEDIISKHVGANTLIALEFATLKAMAKEQKKEIWEIINPEAKNFPRLVGNCVGGGKHSQGIGDKKPDFQEFLLIPNKKTIKENVELNIKIREEVAEEIKKKEPKFSRKVSDEKGWLTGLNEKEVLDILKKHSIDLGVDIAASSFYKRKKYYYENPKLDRTGEEQLGYLCNLIKNYNLFYIEDPCGEQEFSDFAKLLNKFPNSLIVGDDLTVTSLKRLEKAIEMKSINAIIIKPNQNGSLMNVKEVVELAKKNNIKTIFSHRSGETEESILADLAFGFQADFIKCGIAGKEREAKLKRLIEIEKKFEK